MFVFLIRDLQGSGRTLRRAYRGSCDEEFGEDDDEFAVVVGVGCKK